jgi:integrase
MYKYDAKGNLYTVTDVTTGSDKLMAKYSYDANDNLSSVTYGNGTSTIYTYNNGNMIQTVSNIGADNKNMSYYSYDYYLDFVERKRKEGLNPETIRVYMTTFNVLKEYKKEFRISDISLSFIESFDDHMREINGNSPGGRNPKHKNLRTVILDIQKHNIQANNPYKWFKIPSSEIKEVYLDKSELNALIEYTKQFDKSSKEYKILKMYQFSCFCGLRFSDTMDLRWKDVDFENSLIRKMMIKTKTEVITPLFPMARDILLERSNNGKLIGSNEKVFYNFSEPTVNQTLRKETKLAGIDKHITYHSSRHTFATLLVMDNVDIYKISKYLGHKSVNMTERYLKYDLSIAKESAKDISTFSGENK